MRDYKKTLITLAALICITRGVVGQTPMPTAQNPVPYKDASRVTQEEMPFRVCALFSGGGHSSRAGLASRKDASTKIVKAGDTFMGYEILLINYRQNEIVVSKDGKQFIIGLSGLARMPERVAALAGNQAVDPQELLKIKGPMFEPTPEEKEAGIDPNDPITWPTHYRGPAIERLMKQKQGEEYQLGDTPITDSEAAANLGALPSLEENKDDVEFKSDEFPNTTYQKFEPTPGERARGIDPNDATTWPEDYLGPTIERALNPDGKALHSPTP